MFGQSHENARIHFIGIGGIGMSGLAEVLLTQGWQVSGSDMAENANTKRLQALGAQVSKGHDAAHAHGATCVVVSTAIKPDNPELIYAQDTDILTVHRGQVLAEILAHHPSICVAGTHGKTTTTALTYTALCGGEEPGVINGGVLADIGTNAKIGPRDLIVAEADESDQSFLHLKPSLAIITNVEPEHLEHYGGSFDLQKKCFSDFAHSAEKVVLCADDAVLMAMKPALEKAGIAVVTYGLNSGADVYAENIVQEGLQSHFDLVAYGENVGRFTVNLPGVHYVQNSLAALVAAHIYGVEWADAAAKLAAFKGVGRRFHIMGTYKGAVVVDDYAHHPTEIKATLAAAKKGFSGKMVAIIQPHRYTRLQEHMEGFATCAQIADEVYIAPVHSAGEDPIDGVNHEELARRAGAKTVTNAEDVKAQLRDVKEGDVVMCLGAGSITQWAKELASD